MNGDVDRGAITGKRLVDGVVDDFINKVVESALGGRADIHTRAHADGFQALKNLNLIGGVFALDGGDFGVFDIAVNFDLGLVIFVVVVLVRRNMRRNFLLLVVVIKKLFIVVQSVIASFKNFYPPVAPNYALRITHYALPSTCPGRSNRNRRIVFLIASALNCSGGT